MWLPPWPHIRIIWVPGDADSWAMEPAGSLGPGGGLVIYSHNKCYGSFWHNGPRRSVLKHWDQTIFTSAWIWKITVNTHFFPQSSSSSLLFFIIHHLLYYCLITEVIFQRSENSNVVSGSRPRLVRGQLLFPCSFFLRNGTHTRGVCTWQEHLLGESKDLRRSILRGKLFKWEVISYLQQIPAIVYLHWEPIGVSARKWSS